MKHSRIIFATLLALTFAASQPAMAADRKAELRDRFKQRFPQVAALKSSGKIGETSTGTIEAVQGDLDAKQQKLLSEENTDRSELYQIFAKDNGTTPEKVATIEGQRRIKELHPGEYYKDDKGWHKKP